MVSQELQIKESEQVLSVSETHAEPALVCVWLPWPWDWTLPFTFPLILLPDGDSIAAWEGRGMLGLFPDISQWGFFFFWSLHSTESTRAPGFCKGRLVWMFL